MKGRPGDNYVVQPGDRGTFCLGDQFLSRQLTEVVDFCKARKLGLQDFGREFGISEYLSGKRLPYFR